MFVSDNATFTVSDRPTVTGNTITKNGAASNVHLTGSAYITIGGTLNEGASIGVTITNPDGVFATGVSTDCSGKFFSDDTDYEVKYDETDKTNNKLVLKKKETQPPAHEHKWTYTANNATITAACNGAGDCNFGRNGGSVTITAPTNLTYNGEGKTATVTTNNWKGSAVSEIHYYSYVGGNRSDINGVPTNVGEYMAEITVEKQTAFVVYKITDGTTEKIPVDSITLNPTTATLKVSEYRRLNVTVKPKDATNKDVTWTSSNNEAFTEEGNKVYLEKSLQLTDFVVEHYPNGSPRHFFAEISVDGKPVHLEVNHPYAASWSEDYYLTSYDVKSPEPQYCVVQIVREPLKYLMWLGIVMMLCGGCLLFLAGPDREKTSFPGKSC